MYNVSEIKTELIGLVGWNQNEYSTGFQLTDLTSSLSGLYFNEVHPVLTIENLASVCPEFDQMNLADDIAINNAFTAWLKKKTEAGIVNGLEAWNVEKSALGTSKNLLTNTDLFSTTGNFTDYETSTGKIVGFEISPSRSKSLVVKVSKLKLQFDTNQTIDIHLFKSGMKTPVATESVVYTGSGSVQSVSVDWSLYGEGSYFIAYDQQLISGYAVNGVRDYNYANSGQTSFPSGRHFKAVAFNAGVADASELWDLKENQYTVSTNYGLNVSLSVECDYTSFLVEQKLQFKNVIRYSVAIDLMRTIAFNPDSRINRNEANFTRSEILYEINGDTQGRNSSTVFGRLQQAIQAIQFDSSGIDSICLPCRKKSVRFSSLGPA